MELDQFLKAKREFEADLALIIQGAVSEFEAKTGCSPERIDVEMLDVTSIGDDRGKYVVGRVKTRFNFL